MVSPAMLPVLGSMPTVPDTRTNGPAATAWLKSGEPGASGVAMIWRGMGSSSTGDSTPGQRSQSAAGPAGVPPPREGGVDRSEAAAQRCPQPDAGRERGTVSTVRRKVGTTTAASPGACR